MKLPCAILFVDFVDFVRIHLLLHDFLVRPLKLLLEVGILENLILRQVRIQGFMVCAHLVLPVGGDADYTLLLDDE